MYIIFNICLCVRQKAPTGQSNEDIEDKETDEHQER